jgi:hypothetical protein
MKAPIIFIGMHRSGTSMLSRVVEKAGVFMGNKKDENNEAIFFRNFNDWILNQTNSTWDNPYNYKFIDSAFKEDIKKVYELRKKVFFPTEYLGFRKFLRIRSLNNIEFPWGWKDPRNTYTINIWKEIFPEAKVIHIYRNPVDVAQSLKIRSIKVDFNAHNSFKRILRKLFLIQGSIYRLSFRVMDLNEGYRLWCQYVRQALSIKSSINIQYEQLLKNPSDNLEQIFNFIGLDFTKKQLQECSNMFDSTRSCAFLKDEQLLSFYKQIKEDTLMKKLGYNKLV